MGSSYTLESVAEATLDVLDGADAPMALSDICDHIVPMVGMKRRSARLEDTLFDALLELIFGGHVVLLEREDWILYMLRERFFRGKCVRIGFSQLELDLGVFIPGHRLVPLMPYDLYAGDATVFFDGEPLPWGRLEITLQQLSIYLTLLGISGMSAYMATENEETLTTLTAPDPDLPITITILDLSPILEKHPEATGLRVRCDNHRVGEYTVTAVDTSDRALSFSDMTTAVRDLDAAFKTIFDTYPPNHMTIPNQIALAYGLMPEAFLADPPFHFGKYLSLTDNVSLASIGLDTVLWRTGEDPLEECDGAFADIAMQLRDSIFEDIVDSPDEP